MSGDLKQRLKIVWLRFQHFSIDETVDITGIAQLAVIVRACEREFNIYEHLIELVPMHHITTNQNIFEKISNRFCISNGFDLS